MDAQRTLLKQELCDRITVHSPEEDGLGWPSGARELRDVLRQASVLPSWVDSGPYHYVDENMQYLLAGLRSGASNDDPSNTPSDKLASTLGSALRACELVRSQYRQYQYDILVADYSTAVVFTILSACAHIDRQVLLESDAWLAIPCTLGAPPAMHYVCTDLQILLAAAVCAGDTDRFSVHAPRSQAPENRLIGNSAHTVEASSKVPWVPPSTHVFHRWLPSPSSQICGHPFLCMATLTELKIAMSAVLYQRCTWGLLDPIVGVVFSPLSTHVAFILRWYKEDPENPAFPYIYICGLGPQLAFNLTNPRDTLATFATILALCDLSQDLYEDANSRSPILQQPISLSRQWRSDTFNFLCPSEDLVSRISNWTEQIKPSTERDIVMVEIKCAPNNRASEDSTTEEVTRQLWKPSISDNLSETMNLNLDYFKGKYKEYMAFFSQMSVSKSSNESTLAAKSWLISHWLFDRLALPISTAADPEQWVRLCRCTHIWWPKDWLAYDGTKKWTMSDSSAIALSKADREDFEKVFAAVSAFKGMHPDLVEEVSLKEDAPGRSQAGAFDNDDRTKTAKDNFCIIEDHLRQALPVIFETYRRLRSIDCEVEPKNEATWRVAIDTPFSHFFGEGRQESGEDDVPIAGYTSAELTADANNQMEHSLKLPFSRAYHHYSEDSEARKAWEAKLISLVESEAEHSHLFGRVSMRLAKLHLNGDALRHAQPMSPESEHQARQQAVEAKDEMFKEWAKDAHTREKACADHIEDHLLTWSYLLDEIHVLYRAALMETTCVCDALGYLQVPVEADKESLNGFALTSASSQTSEPTTSSFDTLKKTKLDPLLAKIDGTQWRHDIVLPEREEKGNSDSSPSVHGVSYLDLPAVVVEWKKEGGTIQQAMNQHSVNHVTAAWFLEACGITEFPVFGITSDGPVLTLDYTFVHDTKETTSTQPPELE